MERFIPCEELLAVLGDNAQKVFMRMPYNVVVKICGKYLVNGFTTRTDAKFHDIINSYLELYEEESFEEQISEELDHICRSKRSIIVPEEVANKAAQLLKKIEDGDYPDNYYTYIELFQDIYHNCGEGEDIEYILSGIMESIEVGEFKAPSYLSYP